jgi:hypothetical protein
MKKLLPLLLILLFVASGNSFAQFKLGIEPALGMNFNLHGGSDLNETGSGFGIIFGGYAHMMFSKNVGMVTGLVFYDNRSGSYTQKGTDQGVNYSADITASLAYFQIESLFKLAIPSGMYFVVGPVLGFNVAAESEVKLNVPQYPQYNQTSKSSIKETLVRFELKAGTGYEISIAKNIDIVPQFTFGYGLTNVVKDVKWNIMTFQLLVGVKFDLI